jgi:glutamate-ammonia-ligase adenylyltransferase
LDRSALPLSQDRNLREFLDRFSAAYPWLTKVGFADATRAHRNFVALADRGVPLDLLESFRDEMEKYLPGCAEPDMALNNFERLIAKVRSPLSMFTFLARKPRSAAVLLHLFSTSQYFSELIIANPEYFDFLWEHGNTPVDPHVLEDEIRGELLSVLGNDELVLSALRRHRQRELLRIGYRDIILGEPLERITQSISDLADCLVRVAFKLALDRMAARHGSPRTPTGAVAQLAVFALGKLGGQELNYSSDIDLLFMYDFDGATDGRHSVVNVEFFTHVIRELVRLLSANTARGQAFRVDLRLRPHGERGPLCLSLEDTLDYYDKHGRTWERQALVKLRPIAGSASLGEEFTRSIEPFVYRRYLTFVEINDIKVTKRRIEEKTRLAGAAATDVKSGHGGVRDIEFITQFLQLASGGAMPQVRDRNTLRALTRLGAAGCINQDEHSALETAYRLLRKTEHRLQFMFDLQTHRIPEEPAQLDRLALRLGYLPHDHLRPGERFLADLRTITERNRNMLNRLLNDLFPTEDAVNEPETDLMLDPDPSPERIGAVLGRYRFRDVQSAYANLLHLGHEEIPFLSSVRCRHFLAGIAPRLLREIAHAPDPDMALVNLEKVTASLGAKGALWESCSLNDAMLRLYVNLCSWSQFLSEILINNPGMIDELLDTLALNRRATLEERTAELAALRKGAREIEPILSGFKNTCLLQIGVQDILGRRALPETAQDLTDLAEAIIGAIADVTFKQTVSEFGIPTDGSTGNPADFVIVGLGKFGGREMSYHSDLDVMLVYDGDGMTSAAPALPTRFTTTNHHFFTELAQRIVATTSRAGPWGRLYSVDFRLRPTGRSGSLVMPLDRFVEYYQRVAALWERQALTRARVVYGAPSLRERVRRAIDEAVCQVEWRAALVEEIDEMRHRLEESRAPNDIKRGPGGIMDVEFAAQLLQIKFGKRFPDIRKTNTWEFLDAVKSTHLWPLERVAALQSGYTFMRSVESRLRIVYNVCRDDLPADPRELATLAGRLGYDGTNAAERLEQDLARHRQRIRAAYLACLEDERARP